MNENVPLFIFAEVFAVYNAVKKLLAIFKPDE